MQVGSILFTVVVVTVHLQVASILEHWTPFHHLAIWFSVCASPSRFVSWFMHVCPSIPLVHLCQIDK